MFGLPPAKGFATLQPEVMGLSAGGAFRVVDPKEAAESAPLESPPLPCPGSQTATGSCSGMGRCDPSSGTCECDRPGSGPDCSKVRNPPVLGSLLHVSDGSGMRNVRNDSAVAVRAGALAPTELIMEVDQMSPVAFGFAMSSNERILPSSLLSLASNGPRTLALHVTAPSAESVIDPSCVAITLAASMDGIGFGTKTIALWLQPYAASDPTSDPDADFTAAVAHPNASCDGEYGIFVPEMPWPAAPRRTGGHRVGFVVGLVAAALLAASAALWWLCPIVLVAPRNEAEAIARRSMLGIECDGQCAKPIPSHVVSESSDTESFDSSSALVKA